MVISFQLSTFLKWRPETSQAVSYYIVLQWMHCKMLQFVCYSCYEIYCPNDYLLVCHKEWKRLNKLLCCFIFWDLFTYNTRTFWMTFQLSFLQILFFCTHDDNKGIWFLTSGGAMQFLQWENYSTWMFFGLEVWTRFIELQMVWSPRGWTQVKEVLWGWYRG